MSALHQEKQNGARIAIVGGGLAGSLLALALAQKGHAVDVYERRPDPRRQELAAGRSINLGLSKRGMQGLAMVGLLETVLQKAVVMSGRVIHAPDGATRYQPYGKNSNEVLHSIDRNELNLLLLEKALEHPNLRLFFEHKLERVDKARQTLYFEHAGKQVVVQPLWVVGADGAFSTMRRELQYGERADFHQEYLEWGYKELTLAAKPDGTSVIEKTALHVWPRSHCLFVSHPNRDSSHTLTLFLPHEGKDSFATVQTREDVAQLVQKYFPDLAPMLPNLQEQWMQHPTGALLTIRSAPWRYGDWAVLVGDACHAVYPFFGQGMNSAFEDCCTLMQTLQEHGFAAAPAFAAYEEKRRRHTDALCELSKRNFIELRQTVQSPWFLLRKKVDLLLNRIMPSSWLPLYTMIAHTTMPYADAWDKAKRQDRLLNATAIGLGGIGLWLTLYLTLGAR
ncbi:FAD-dependent monooxygenase [Massilia sp. W12]|uniref:FAD-dependent oxidoreductase n=1 Tax=Massilia sp. W12 TaxID=3126507 RepID=UPI0030CD2D95